MEFLDIVLLAAHVAEQQLKRNNYVITEGSVLLSPSTLKHEMERGNEYPICDDSGSQIREASAEDLALLGSRDQIELNSWMRGYNW